MKLSWLVVFAFSAIKSFFSLLVFHYSLIQSCTSSPPLFLNYLLTLFHCLRYTASAKIPSALSPSSSAKNSSSSSSTSSAASSHDGRSKSEQLPLSNCNDNNIDANVDLDESDDADALEASWQIAAAIQLADAANQAGSGIDHHDQSSTSNSSSSDSIKIAGGDSAGSQRTVAAADRPSFAASLLAPRAKKQVPPAASSTSHPPAPAESSKGKRGSGSALGWFSAKPKS